MRKIISLFVAALFSAAMFATTYTVVGDGCGLTWDQTSSVNDMTADGNVFKLVKADVELTAGTINYKIVENHSWDKSYPQNGNANFKIEKSGKYDVTFTLDLAATPEYSVLAELKEEVDVLPSIQMHGNFTGTWADTEEFEVAEDKKSASLKLNLDVKTFEFGMRIGGPGNWTANGAVITRENPSTSLATGEGNMKLTADLAGEYVFTYTYETQTLAVTFPEGEIIPVEHTYTVAGTPASLFGTEWDPSNTDNDMTKQEDGSYKWEKKDLALEAGLIKFKVVEDHDWANPNYPSDDYELNITEAATYTLTITFNNGEVAAQALKDGEAPVEQAKFYVTGNKALVGEELEWKPNALKSMTDTLELSLEAGVDYQLKVTLNGTWTEGNIRGFNDLSEKAEGLNDVGGDDHNIGFRLAENGIVKVVYIAAANEDPEIFKLIGNFSSEEPPVTLPTVAIAGAMNEWNAEANVMVAAEDGLTASVKIELEAIDYNFKVVVNGEWRCYADQIYDITRENATLANIDNEGGYNDNFNLKADAAGEYIFTWTYATNTLVVTFPGEVPPVEQPKFYVTGNDVIAGDKAWQPNAIPSMKDTLVLTLPAETVVMRLTLNGTWEGEQRDFRNLTDTAAGLLEEIDEYSHHNIRFMLKEAGEVKIIYNANEFKLEGNFSTEEPPVTADGFYLVGTITGWKVVPDAPHTFQTTAVEGEYILHFTLAAGDAIKVVGVANGVETWYPEGMGTEYTVDADHAGEKDIYFRPAGNAEWAAFGGFIYIAPNAEEAIINTEDGIKAVKTIENGQMVIIKAGVRYNVLGSRL